MQTSRILKKVIRAMVVLLTVLIVTAALGVSQPVTAKADDTWLLPETISTGGYHACGIKNDGTLACWGYNGNGQSTPPAGTFTQVSAGQYHTCGIQSDGTLACWGLNTSSQSTPPAGTFIQVSAGTSHTCAVKSNGVFTCWGDNTYGQLLAFKTIYPLIMK